MIASSDRLMGSRPRASLVTDSRPGPEAPGRARMVRLWVDTGAWPLPRCARRTSFLFEILGCGALARDRRLAGRARFHSHRSARKEDGPRLG